MYAKITDTACGMACVILLHTTYVIHATWLLLLLLLVLMCLHERNLQCSGPLDMQLLSLLLNFYCPQHRIKMQLQRDPSDLQERDPLNL